MSDIFLPTDPVKAIRKLKKEHNNWICARHPDINRRKIPLFKGDIHSINKALLFILPQLKEKPWMTLEDQTLDLILSNQRLLSNSFQMYAYPIMNHITRENIKDYRCWFKRIRDFINPVLTVTLGERAQMIFVNSTYDPIINHGQLKETDTGEFFITPRMDYYLLNVRQEENVFRQKIQDEDWAKIKQIYEERTK